MSEKAKNDKDQETSIHKKRIQGFLNDILRFGSVKGFRYFEMSLRGREELLVDVQNEQYHSGSTWNKKASKCDYDMEDDGDEDQSSFEFNQSLPRNCESLVLSRSTQKMLSGFHFLEIGLPPASPSKNEIVSASEYSTLFLLAAYARYKCPYVWVRTNHERLVKISNATLKEQSQVRDSPLKLKSVSEWSTKDIKVWDIIAEIVRMNVVPAPRNPFAVNYCHFENLPVDERIVATGAMVYFLQKVLSKEHSFNSLVSEDLHEVLKMHFRDLQAIAVRPSTKPFLGSSTNRDENQPLRVTPLQPPQARNMRANNNFQYYDSSTNFFQ